MAPKKDTTPSKKKDKYRIRNWRQYSAPQAHDQEVLIVPSCIEDEGRPFEVSFQERASNHSKLL